MSTEKVTPYRCDVPGCGKYFTRRFNMKSHMRWHTGARPFECPFDGCDAKFKWKSSFASHMRSHQQTSAKKQIKEGGKRTAISIHDLLDTSLMNDTTLLDNNVSSSSHEDLSSKSVTGFLTVVKVDSAPGSAKPVDQISGATDMQSVVSSPEPSFL